MAVKELREKQAKLVADARGLIEQINENTDEARAAELEGQHDAAMAEYDRLQARIEREEKLEERERLVNLPDPRRPEGQDVRSNERPEDAEQRQKATKGAWDAYLRGGPTALTAEQRSLLKRDPESRTFAGQGVTANADGGYLVPQGFFPELMVSMKAYGPMLDPGVTRQITTARGNQLPWPTMDDTSNTGALVSENTQVSLSELTFGNAVLHAYKYTSGVVLVSSELLQDSAIDVEQVVRDAMAIRLGRIVNTHLTTGDGSSKPQGIVTAATANLSQAAAADAAITFDDLINLEHKVDPAYRAGPSARFQMSDAVLKAVRKLKNGDGDYIWQPANVTTNAPPTILGYAYSINQAMDGTMGAGTTSVVFGAHDRYVVRRVEEFSIRRLTERYADYDQVGFIGFGRFDGVEIDAKAIAALTHP